MTRDEILSMALEAKAGVYLPAEDGLPATWVGQDFAMLERFAALVAAKVIARTPPPPLVVSMSDVDQAQLAAMLEKRRPMPLVAAPDDSALDTERAARQEAQQRLADAQELAARSGLAHRKAVQAAVAEAVAAEREACKSIAVAEQKTMCEIALSHPDGSASRDRLFARARSAESIAQAIEKRGTP